MPSDGLTLLWAILGFGLVMVAGAKLGAGSHTCLAGLFAMQGGRAWPKGVQESDAPRFVLASPPRGTSAPAGHGPAVEALESEIEELYSGAIRTR